MGAIALVAPFLLGVALSETAAWCSGLVIAWQFALGVAVILLIEGVALGLWIRARYQKLQEAPSLWWFSLALFLLLLFAGFSPLSLLRALCWSFAVWLGLRWLPKAIFQIGDMC
jgi:hypothetical protein